MQAMPASLFNLGLCFCFAGVFCLLQMGVSLFFHSNTSLTLSENLKRVQLVRQVIRSPQSIQVMDNKDIAILLNKPVLNRNELAVNAWHYYGETCALDIYFSKGQSKPDYIEYRALSLNADISAHYQDIDQSGLNSYCLKEILEAQGVDTPSSYARKPTPTVANPYRS